MHRRTGPVLFAAALAAVAVAAVPAGATQVGARRGAPTRGSNACPPSARALGYSDALDKYTQGGAELGGLSSIAYDSRAHAYVSAVDNHASDPARLWFYRDLASPHVVGPPLVLRRPDGTPYTGTDSDNEGLGVLPDGDYLVSSETEPSIRIFGRDGVQQASLPVPARFAVTGTTPAGQATSNATLEGLTIAPGGREVIASMENALSGDVSAAGDATYHRMLVYRLGGHSAWRLVKQLGYRTDPGERIPEVATYSADSMFVEEASYAPATGNEVRLFVVHGIGSARDVSAVANLSAAPARDIVHKTLVADLVDCPTLGATAKETQANPLLDNFEGMMVTGSVGRNRYGVTLISDDNFSATQTTRLLDLEVRVPRR
jgi:uncharacterized protein